VTGPSGSGKSSLLFDTVWAEAQRRYTESLPAYVRQILGVWEKPQVERIEGLSPAVALDARPAGQSPRSTVGTATEIHDYLRLLFSHAGVPSCVKCGATLERTPRAKIIEELLNLPEGTGLTVTAPLGVRRLEELPELFAQLLKEGFLRVLWSGELYSLDEPPPRKGRTGEAAVVVDRLSVGPKARQRLAEAVETALSRTGGVVGAVPADGRSLLFSDKFRCARCDITFPELSPQAFSFNNPQGACPVCHGVGTVLALDEEIAVDKTRSLSRGAVRAWQGGRIPEKAAEPLKKFLAAVGDDLDTPLEALAPEHQKALLYGTEGRKSRSGLPAFPGIFKILEEENPPETRLRRNVSMFRSEPCPRCGGARLKAESLAVKVGGKNIHELSSLSVAEARLFFEELKVPSELEPVVRPLLSEIVRRLDLLIELGLSYVSLSRSVPSLSAGEHQRLRLANQIGAELSGILYVLDEPTVGLHPRETEKLIRILRSLCERGSTVVVVEHDLEVIKAADHVVDLGPGAGPRGGNVVAEGSPSEIAAFPESLIGRYLSGEMRLEGDPPNKGKGYLEIKGASEHNLKNIDVRIPLRTLTCVTGPSGSGKSTLVVDVLWRTLARRLNSCAFLPGRCESITWEGNLTRVVAVDQSPIGRTPRSNPATYTGLFGPIRHFFSLLPLSRMRGYGPARFSFNAKGGRCEVCRGEGVKRVSMHFLPDIMVPCEVCGGARYNAETLEVKYRGLSIADVLELAISEAKELFGSIPKVAERLRFLDEIGLGYLKLGQRADTLSGGEAQRLKLSRELARLSRNTLYVLDEPTTGLHVDDVKLLLRALRGLVDAGNTVVVIEHNVDFIARADYVIDMGPGGGEEGGRVVARGTPEEVARNADSVTGPFLRKAVVGAR